MKLVHLLLVGFLVCAVTVNAQNPSDGKGVEMTVGQDTFLANLQLNTDLIKLEACSGDRLRFTLRLNFTNKGRNAVILDKRSSATPRYMISRNLKNAMKKAYEIEVHRLIALDSAGTPMDSVPDESQFVILKPGETYDLIRVLTADIGADSDSDGSRPLRGQNVLQLVVLTWYYPRASNTKWREQWQTKGYLWSDPITSIPMPFKVETNTPVTDCP